MEPLIIDTGYANVKSVRKALEFLGYTPSVTSNPVEICKGTSLILPGVGSFDQVIRNLREKKIDSAIYEALTKPDSKILGICLGLQLLSKSSTEGTPQNGLGLIDGDCKKLEISKGLKIPHVGFNTVVRTRESKLLIGIPENFSFYFLHSYYLQYETTPSTVATSAYGNHFTAVIEFENRIFGTQFHPEKSQKIGLKIFSNFLET